MSRTYKDQKENKLERFAKAKRKARPFKQKYIQFKQCGYETGCDEDSRENMDGDLCPMCGTPTHFEDYYLACSSCGWLDAEDKAVDEKIDETFTPRDVDAA